MKKSFRKVLLLITAFFGFGPSFVCALEGPPPIKLGADQSTNVEKAQGVPKVIRQNPATEIFLIGVNGGFIIPQNESHNRLLNLFVKSQQTRQPIAFTYDSKTRLILHVEGDPGPPKVSNPDDGGEEPSLPVKKGSSSSSKEGSSSGGKSSDKK